MTYRYTVQSYFSDLLEMLYFSSAFERYQCTEDCPTFVTQQTDLIFENPRQPSLGSYIRFLLSRPDQSPGTDGGGWKVARISLK